MKRSEINAHIEAAKKFAKEMNMALPPFAFWTVDDWASKGSECDDIRKLMLGWDVTDFGLGNYERIGRTLFTLRNGSNAYDGCSRNYSEKFIFIDENQAAPIHFHRKKTEDIINRGGGNILVQASKATADGQKSDEDFELSVNGVKTKLKADEIIRLTPGESVLIPAGTIHEFWSEEGTGVTLSGEVGTICDDVNDNVFLETCGRFCEVEEDEPMLHYLCNEYPDVAV
ncbi:MAG: D-lyxose/D-mannose family sugar isomerase [Sedimentisphaeraceae bacterium JB056]